MKCWVSFLSVFLFLIITSSCSKTDFISSPAASLSFSSDTLHYDTVFTTTGSITQSVKIFNNNDKKLRLSNVILKGGSASAFKLNVDGTPGHAFSNIELEPNDSVYVFVTVSINPNSANLPFIVQDSILVNYNGNNKHIQLQAYGQNANFFKNRRITKDSIWKNNLPFVILNGLSIDSNVSLTIEKGCRIYAHADAPFIVNGSLQVNGDTATHSRVIFQGDRLDPGYNDLPASWPGIYFSSSSRNNVLNYAVIKNAYQGIITEPTSNRDFVVNINNCIIDNIYDAGIIGFNSSIKAVNCLISNCGNNISIIGGGSYLFTHCTVSTINNIYIDSRNPVLSVSNAYQTQTAALFARFTNCIFYAEGGLTENSVLVEKKGSPALADYDVVFENVLYKNKVDQPNAVFKNASPIRLPLFDSINASRRYFNFRLKSNAFQAVNAGLQTGTITDLDGKMRDAKPDIGCYEH